METQQIARRAAFSLGGIGEYLTYKEWKRIIRLVSVSTDCSGSEYLTYKEWKPVAYRKTEKLPHKTREYLTYKEWKLSIKLIWYRIKQYGEYLTYKEWKR